MSRGEKYILCIPAAGLFMSETGNSHICFSYMLSPDSRMGDGGGGLVDALWMNVVDPLGIPVLAFARGFLLPDSMCLLATPRISESGLQRWLFLSRDFLAGEAGFRDMILYWILGSWRGCFEPHQLMSTM